MAFKARTYPLLRTGAKPQKTPAPQLSPATNTRPAPLQLHELIQRAQTDVRSLSANDISVLQTTLGNGVVQRLLAPSQSADRNGFGSSAAIDLGAPVQCQDGPEEEELLQGKFEVVQRQADLEEEELLQGKFETVQRQADLEEEELLQGKSAVQEMPTQFQPGNGPGENRTGMPDSLKSGLEDLSGMDLSGVRVHYNSPGPPQINAAAYAQGQDIHLGPGQEQHLPHEGWHTVQQMQGRVRPTVQAAGVPINDDPALEREADLMGAKAATTQKSKRSGG